MRSAEGSHNFPIDDPTWHLVAEWSLPGAPGVSGDQEAEFDSGLLVETVRDLGLPLSQLNRIKVAIEEAVRNFRRPSGQVGSALPGIIRLFARSVEDSHPGALRARHAEGPSGRGGRFLSSGGQSRGWGFYLMKRIVDPPSVPIEEPHFSIELFLYPEGKPPR